MSTLSQLIYTVASMEMSKDNAHLTNFRSDLRQIRALLEAGQAMRVHFTPYAEAVDAAMAWDVAVKELYGEFATFNTVPQPWLEEDV